MKYLPHPFHLSGQRSLVGLLFLALSLSASAAPLYWDGGNGGWDSVTSWSTASGATTPDPAAVPGIGDDVTFNITGANAAETINLNADQSAGSIVFRSTGTTALQGGGTNRSLTIGAGGITVNSGTGTPTIGSATAGQNVGVILNASQSWTNNASSLLTLQNSVTGAASTTATLTTGGTGSTSIGTGIHDGTGGSVSVIKNGTGTLTIRGASGYTGTTTLNSGTINNGGVSVTGITGTGAMTINGGAIANSGSSGTNTLTLTNSSYTLAGDVTLTAGTGGTQTLSLGSSAYTVTLNGNRTITANGSTANSSNVSLINGAFAESAANTNLTWTGNGNVRANLGGNSSYTGTTTVLAGNVQFTTNVLNNTNSAFGNSNGAILLGATTGSTGASILSLNSTVSFQRDITLQSGGTGNLVIGNVLSSSSGSGNLNYSGRLTLGTGTTGRSVLLHRGTFSGDIVDPAGLLSSPGVVTIGTIGATNGNADASFVTTLSGNNTFTGGVNLTSSSNTATLAINSPTALGTGTLTISPTSGTGAVALNNSTAAPITLTTNNSQVWNNDFSFSGTRSLDMGTGAVSLGTIAAATRSVNVVANSFSIGGTITDGTNGTTPTVNLTKNGAGTLVLYGSSSYTGTTTIAGGTLQLGNGGTAGSIAGSIVNSGTLVFNRSDAGQNLSQVISGAGGLTQAGSGKTTISGANTYTGPTNINAGTFVVNGSLSSGSLVSLNSATLSGNGTVGGSVTTAGSGSILSPGDGIGTLTLAGGLDTSSGATLDFALGTASDLLSVGVLTGSSAANGLSFNFSNSGGFAAGVPYTLIDYSSASGLDYSDLFAASIPSGYVLDSTFGNSGFLIDNGATNLQVQFSAVPEPSAGAFLFAGAGLFVALRSRRRVGFC